MGSFILNLYCTPKVLQFHGMTVETSRGGGGRSSGLANGVCTTWSIFFISLLSLRKDEGNNFENKTTTTGEAVGLWVFFQYWIWTQLKKNKQLDTLGLNQVKWFFFLVICFKLKWINRCVLLWFIALNIEAMKFFSFWSLWGQCITLFFDLLLRQNGFRALRSFASDWVAAVVR